METNGDSGMHVELTQPVPHLLAGGVLRKKLKRKKKRIVVDRKRKCPCPERECEESRKQCETLKESGYKAMLECFSCDQKATDKRNSDLRKSAYDASVDGG